MSEKPGVQTSTAGSDPAVPELLQVRRDGNVLQMDLTTLVTLIQQHTLNAAAELNSSKLTGGAWKKLGELELYRVLVAAETQGKADKTGGMPLPPSAAPPSSPTEPASPEVNLGRFFESLAVKQLRIDGIIAVVSTVVAGGLSIVAHGSVIVLILMIVGWVGGYFLADQILFPRWIQTIRTSGYRQSPWQTRQFLIVAVALSGYFAIALFLPRLPQEGTLRFVDSVVGLLYGAAAAAIWTFRTDVVRMKRTFERTR
jgi:hypothetical protein